MGTDTVKNWRKQNGCRPFIYAMCDGKRYRTTPESASLTSEQLAHFLKIEGWEGPGAGKGWRHVGRQRRCSPLCQPEQE